MVDSNKTHLRLFMIALLMSWLLLMKRILWWQFAVLLLLPNSRRRSIDDRGIELPVGCRQLEPAGVEQFSTA